jgi:ABC-type ATPase involved in cell division
MPIAIYIPRVGADPLPLELTAGSRTYILGPNGAGKSSLMHDIYRGNPSAYRRVAAHRQTWFNTGTVSISALQRGNHENAFRSNDINEGRWLEQYADARVQAALYDVVAVHHRLDRELAAAFRAGDMAEATRLGAIESPLAAINAMFRQSNISIELELRGESFIAKRPGADPYGAERLSDGERAALLLCAVVLTAPDDTVILVDEPERHLHRSITEPLLRLLFDRRPTCAFVVSTHEVMLPVATPHARTILLRGCIYSGNSASAYDCDVLPAGLDIPEQLKRDILGARRTVLFIEGDDTSLDKPIYSLIFPGVSVIAKGGCSDVEQAVTRLHGVEGLHWIKAYGIVDGDRRTAADIARLRARGVFALPMISVEALYYRSAAQTLAAGRLADTIGGDAIARLADAKSRALAAIAPHAERLSRRAAHAAIRDAYSRQAPTDTDIGANMWHTATLNMGVLVQAERERFQQALQAHDLDELMRGYAIRDTPALGVIASVLGFRTRQQYEAAVRQALTADPVALADARALFGDLVTAMQ